MQLVIDKHILRNSWNREIDLLHDKCPEWDDNMLRTHARSTVVESIEVQVLRILDQIEGERQEMINIHLGY